MERAEFEQHLQAAMVSRPVIEQAKGIIMGMHSIPAEAAFAVIRRVSQNHNVPVHTLAESLVLAASGRQVVDAQIRGALVALRGWEKPRNAPD
jgi:AmiR/NasT family two-component response regulator